MHELPDTAVVAERLRSTALRGFFPAPDRFGGIPGLRKSTRITISYADCPIPSVLKLALSLIGLEAQGPAEKVAWWVPFAFEGHDFELAHQKFGLRLSLTDQEFDSARVEAMLQKVEKKLLSAMRIVEKLINTASKGILDAGDATVINQHARLQKAYAYFRDRATNPASVEDVHTTFGSPGGPEGFTSTFVSGRAVMNLNATHDMVAAVTAYLSRLEHDLVLTLPFAGFDASQEHLSTFIGTRWGLKYERVLGRRGEAEKYLQRLVGVVERWRNPYAHGGFEKGHGSTVYVHVPGAGALPIGLTATRSKPFFSLSTASDPAIQDVFALFDEFDAWFGRTQRNASRWIESTLDVRFDAEFCEVLRSVEGDNDAFDAFLVYAEYEQYRLDNMDF